VRPAHSIKLLALLFAVALPLHPAAAQDDMEAVGTCDATCVKLEKEGQLRKGYGVTACAVRLCLAEAEIEYENGEFEASLRSLDRIRGLAGQSASFSLQEGLVYYALGRFENAVTSFDRILEIHPDSIRASAQRAHALVRLDRIPEARAQFEKILTFPAADREFKKLRTHSYILGNLGVLKLAEGDLAGGKAELQKALELDGRNELAVTFLNRVLPELEAKHAQPQVVLKLVALFEELSLKRPGPAMKMLEQVLVSWPDFKLAYEIAADTQRRYGYYEMCEETLRHASRRFPDDVKLKAERIRCSMLRYGMLTQESEPARDELRELARTNPDHPLIRELLILMNE
jgi:tetratricopeptide (TPR) repeat protein